MRTVLACYCVTLFLAVSPVVLAADPAGNMNTQKRIEKLGKELADTWEKYASDSQKATRQQNFQDINTVFTREIAKAEAPKDKKIVQDFKAYLDNLDHTTDLFKVEKMKAERALYIRGCGVAFKREVIFATDYAAERTTQQCYDLLLNMLEEARDKFVIEKDKDLRAEAFQTLNTFFSDLTTKAKIPDVDHAAAMDKNIKEAKARFPITTEAMKSKNGPAYMLCENAAKLIKQRALTKQN